MAITLAAGIEMQDCWNGYALVGYGNKQPYLRHRVDGNRVECYLTPTYYRQMTLMWFLVGPVLTVGLICGAFARGGWLGSGLILAVTLFGWWAMIGSWRSQYLAVIDGDRRTVEVSSLKGKPPHITVDFKDDKDIRVTSFFRQRSGNLYGRLEKDSKYRMPKYRCTELAIDLNDGRTLSLVESVDEAEVRSIEQHVTALVLDA